MYTHADYKCYLEVLKQTTLGQVSVIVDHDCHTNIKKVSIVAMHLQCPVYNSYYRLNVRDHQSYHSLAHNEWEKTTYSNKRYKVIHCIKYNYVSHISIYTMVKINIFCVLFLFHHTSNTNLFSNYGNYN